MRAAAVVPMLLAALCIASAARITDDDLMNLKESLSDSASIQVGGCWLLLLLLLLLSPKASGHVHWLHVHVCNVQK
jgi:hypothetical protein